MITPSFALTAAERVLPKLALDFTTALLDSRVTFTRSANTATVTNSSGLIALVNADIPRFDFNPITLACKGLLIEEARTNNLLQSQDLSTSWTPANATITTDQVVSPDGTQNADLITSTGAGGRVTQTVSAPSTSVYTYSVYLKKDATAVIELLVRNNTTATNWMARFNLDTFAITNVSAGATASMVDVGNGWRRCFITTASITSGNSVTSYIYAGIGTSGQSQYAWGAQLEAGAFATSYIPTTTTALTRNADVATMTGTNFSDWFNASEGTVVAWGTQQSEDQSGGQRRGFTCISDATNNNRISLSPVQFNVVTGGSPVVNQTFAGFVANQNYKIAGAYKLNNSQSASNATLSSNDTSCAVPTVTQLQFGTFRIADGLMCGHLQKFMFYPQRLTSAEIQAVSK
jgi:hypothetical protein